MHIVQAVTDDLLKFATKLSKGDAVEFATDVIVLWDSCAKGAPLEERYEAFRKLLSSRWGEEVTKGTAYLVMEKASELVTALKKTHTSSAS